VSEVSLAQERGEGGKSGPNLLAVVLPELIRETLEENTDLNEVVKGDREAPPVILLHQQVQEVPGHVVAKPLEGRLQLIDINGEGVIPVIRVEHPLPVCNILPQGLPRGG